MKIIHIKRLRDRRKKRVAAYCRVSTRLGEQEESYETQMRYYRDYINTKPEWEFAGIYSDEKSATKVKNRPGFQQMVRDAVDGRIDLILCKSISRFSRNIVDCQNYTSYLWGNGVEVFFGKEHISSADPSSSMIFSLMGVIAQDESCSIGENIRWAYRERYKKGEYNLGNNRIRGYDSVRGRLVLNRDAWSIRFVYRLFLEGKSYREISRLAAKAGAVGMRSGAPLTNSAIIKILSNETYVGDKLLQKQPPVNFLTKKPDANIPYESNYLPDDHEGIISRSDWERVQKLLGRRRESRKNGISRSGSLLYGRIICGECGEPFIRRSFRGYARVRSEGIYYKAWCCRERKKGRKGNGCRNVIVREEELLQRISSALGWEWNGADAFDRGKFCEIADYAEVTAEGVNVKLRRASIEILKNGG